MITCKCCKKNFEDYDCDVAGHCYNCARELSLIPAFYQSKNFDNFVVNGNAAAVEKCKNFLGNGIRGLYLYGDPGTGKTHLGISILRECVAAGHPIRLAIMPDLFLRLRNSFNSDESWNEQDIIKYYQDGILMLDDFAAEKQTEYAITTVYTMINRRYINGWHKIIITSNFSLQKIAEIMNDRIASRIAEMCDIVKLTGDDYRVKRGIL